MSLKTSIVTFVSLILIIGAGTSWSQSPSGKPERDTPVKHEKSQTERHHSGRSIFPDDLAGLQHMAIDAYQQGDYLRFVQATIKLREKRPYEQQFLVGMVVGAALLGRANTAYNYMHVMQQQGLSYDFNSTEDTQSIRNTEVYDYLNDLLVEAGQPSGEGRVAFTLPDAKVQPETIAWDDSRGKFLVGTIESGAILAVSPGGETEELLHATDENGLLAIIGIAVDAAHDRLWVTTAGVPGFSGVIPTELGRGALVEFKLDTLQLLHRFDVPVDGLPHVPGSVAVTPAGDVYLLDRAVQMVFRKPANGEKLKMYLASKDLSGLKDLALSAAGDKLYLADAALGIAVADLEKGTLNMLATPENLNLSGLSGLSYSEGHLFVLQNGIEPQRLMRLDLDPKGISVRDAVPLAVALPDFQAPSFGTVQGGTVYYFAGANGSGAKGKPEPVVVLKTPVELSEDIAPVEQRKFEADRLKNKPRSEVESSPDSDS